MLDGWIVNTSVAIPCFVFLQSYTGLFWMHIVFLSWCCQSQFELLCLRLLIAHWLCIKIALCHTLHAIYGKIFIVEKLKKKNKNKIFLWKAICFARLCLYSQYNYCRLYEFENELSSLQLTLCLILSWGHNLLFAQ